MTDFAPLAETAPVCRRLGHADGCPGAAGGTHIRRAKPTRKRPPLWIASVDGVGHARTTSTAPRTLCDQWAVPERYAWPEKARCVACLAVVG